VIKFKRESVERGVVERWVLCCDGRRAWIEKGDNEVDSSKV